MLSNQPSHSNKKQQIIKDLLIQQQHQRSVKNLKRARSEFTLNRKRKMALVESPNRSLLCVVETWMMGVERLHKEKTNVGCLIQKWRESVCDISEWIVHKGIEMRIQALAKSGNKEWERNSAESCKRASLVFLLGYSLSVKDGERKDRTRNYFKKRNCEIFIWFCQGRWRRILSSWDNPRCVSETIHFWLACVLYWRVLF